MRSAIAFLVLFASLLVLPGCQESSGVPTESQKTRVNAEAKAGGYQTISPAELFDLVSSRENMIIIDATPPVHFREAHILGATNYQFPASAGELKWDAARSGGPTQEDFARTLGPDKGLRVVVYAENIDSTRADLAARWAKKLGYNNVFRLVGGLSAWQAAGNPTRSLK